MATPLVSTTSPSNGATDAALNGPLRFTFSTTIDSSTVNDATFQVYEADTLQPVPGSVYASGTAVVFLPTRAFSPGLLYKAIAVGQDHSSRDYIKSDTGDGLALTYEIQFKAGSPAYVPLDQVAARSDLDGIGPVRAVDPITPSAIDAAVSTAGVDPLVLQSVVPPGFTSQVSTSLTGVVFTFNHGVDSDFESYVSLEVAPIMGLDRYYADHDGADKVWLKYMAPTGTVNGVTPADFDIPTGMWTATGTQLIWSRSATGEPDFPYNAELLFTLDAELLATGGGSLGVDTYVVLTTTFFPLFVGVRQLRLELGPAARNLYDDTISRVILKNSIDAWEQSGHAFDIDNPYPSVRRYVACKSYLDIIDYIEGLTAGTAGSSKQLGDLSIRYGTGRANDDRYTRALECMKKALVEIRALRHQSDPAVAQWGVNAPDARNDYRRRTWDQASLGFEGRIGQPIANTELGRLRALALASDHHGNAPAVYFGRTVVGGRALFEAQSGDST